jgi:DNA-directed RNA polymerase subunit RPC12/RpoP
MIRFRCLHCGKTLKASEVKAGASIICPRCKKRSAAPAGDSDDAFEQRTGPKESSRRAEGPERAVALHGGQASSLFSGMSPRLRRAVALVAGMGVLSVVLAVVVPLVPSLAHLDESARCAAMLLVPSSAILVLVLLHAHGTSCPDCGRWWMRTKVETEFVDREVIDKDGVPFARSTYRTIYECGRCQHRWSATFTDEYKEFIRERPSRQRLE